MSYAHAGNQYNNAGWMFGTNNRFMVYGDGDGITFGPFVALDISAHEFGHGINEFSSNLGSAYQNQEEDALNEGLSDIWGTCVKHSTAPVKPEWLLGGEILLTGTFNCLRNLQDPKSTLAREGQHPNTYHGQFWSSTGEPHFNSTVLSHWFYLVVQGGNGTNDNSNVYNVSAVGIDEAQRIVYQAESNYIHSGDGYSDARNAMISAAQDLYGVGSCEEITVTNAWYAVGVGAVYSGNAGLSISGDDSFCTTSNAYTIPNLPAGSSVSWSTTPAGIAMPDSPNLPQTTLTKNNDGIITLTATISNACGGPITVTKNDIIVGTPAPILYAIQVSRPGEPTKIDVYATTSYNTTDPIPGVTAYHWYKDGILLSSTENKFTWYIPCNVTSSLACEVVNACGVSGRSEIEETGGCRELATGYTVSPNPAGATVTVSVLDTKAVGTSNTNPIITAVSIYDNQGNLKKHEIFNQVKKATLDISGLHSGNYFIEISNGSSQVRKQLVIIK